MAEAAPPPDLIAYEIHPDCGVSIVPAPVDREWMDSAADRFPYRCLPLNIANQNGWFLLNRTELEAYWYGGPAVSDVEVRFIGRPDNHAHSHFGVGMLTFNIPYLFRTPPGVNLWVKGPTNHPKDGIQALEGIVEADWNAATFTMNWKFTRPFEWVRFRKDEPICQILPVPRGYTESFSPRRVPLKSNAELKAQYDKWDGDRLQFLNGLKSRDPDVVARKWQKDYFQGKTPLGGDSGGDHQTRLVVKPFPDKPEIAHDENAWGVTPS